MRAPNKHKNVLGKAYSSALRIRINEAERTKVQRLIIAKKKVATLRETSLQIYMTAAQTRVVRACAIFGSVSAVIINPHTFIY